jgi:hypothetical protein
MTTLVTSGPPIAGHPDAVLLPSAIAQELEALLAIQGRARGSGLRGLVLTVPRWIGRWWRRRRLVRRVIPALSAAIEEGVGRASGSATAGAALVVCLGGIDVVAAERLRGSARVVVAPGGLRWLGDRRAPGFEPQERTANPA